MALNRVPLNELATVDISGVDKKISEGEKKVLLCNYTDVYKNWAITKHNSLAFMEASASTKEIALFSLKKGQVALTKDSETRDDIGISCYISEDFENIVLGYHCALITPNPKVLDGKFLNVFLHSSTANKYFEANASGSGQRFTLTSGSIGGIKIPQIDLSDQKAIGKLFSLIDRKIEINNELTKELQLFAQRLYDYWFIQFDFPDEHGNSYKQNGGEMKFDAAIKRLIPVDWKVCGISSVADIYQSETISNSLFDDNAKHKVYGAGGHIGNYSKYNHENGEVILSCRGSCDNVDFTMPKSWITGNAMVVTPNNRDYYCKEYLYYTFKRFGYANYVTGSVQKQLTRLKLIDMKLVLPPKSILDLFEKRMTLVRKELQGIIEENDSLNKLRAFLIPLLINGQARIND